MKADATIMVILCLRVTPEVNRLKPYRLILLPGLWVYWMDKQPIPLFEGYIISGIFIIMNTLKVINDRPFKYLSLIKFKDKKGETK